MIAQNDNTENPSVGGNESGAASYVNEMARLEQDLLVVGLTGRVGTGLQDVADIFTGDVFRGMLVQPLISKGFEDYEMRDFRNIERYLRLRWFPFVEVSMKSAMVTFLLDELVPDAVNPSGQSSLSPALRAIRSRIDVYRCKEYKFDLNGYSKDPVRIYDLLDGLLKRQKKGDDKGLYQRSVYRLRATHRALVLRYRETRDEKVLTEYKDKFEALVEDSVGWLNADGVDLAELAGRWKVAFARIKDRRFDSFDAFACCYGIVPALSDLLWEELEAKGKRALASLVFQRLGNEVRAYGRPCFQGMPEGNKRGHGKNIFALSARAGYFCKVARSYRRALGDVDNGRGKDGGWNPAYIVISSFKNPFEALYFRKKYSSFFLLAISGEGKGDNAPSSFPFDSGAGMDYVSIGENPSKFKGVYKGVCDELKRRLPKSESLDSVIADPERLDGLIAEAEDDGVGPAMFGIGESQYEYAKYVLKDNGLRHVCYKEGAASFILQDVVSCVEGADVFITRDMAEPSAVQDIGLLRQLARFAVLAMHPGLLRPTRLERCMQTAMTAKLNSGCLSRQVGAVVADSEFNILSLGWNDVPCGSESCMRRNVMDVVRKFDTGAYSRHELNDPAYREYLDVLDSDKEDRLGRAVRGLRGLPAAYCFKDMHQDIIRNRDQIHTRAIHAEERALAACGPRLAKGGFLFSTSSPCELCAKRAKEAGISRIYYIERYPGISHAHVIDDGPETQRASYEFFVGAVGSAYVRLYTPVMPYKDELEALGVNPVGIHKQIMDDREKANTLAKGEHDAV